MNNSYSISRKGVIMRKQPQSFEFNLEFEGKIYSATYSVSSKVVKIDSMFGTISTQIGGSTAKIIARTLFREILEGAKSRKEI